MSVDQMRAAIADVYSGNKWQRKVSKMHDDQVIAVYNNFLRSGKFSQKEKEPPRDKKDKQRGTRKQGPFFDDWSGSEQLSLFK